MPSSMPIQRPPLWFTLLLITGCVMGWQYWPKLLLQAIAIQRELNGLLSDLLYDIQEHRPQAIVSFVLVSFGYGILHSLGPGHGKVIVATYLTTQKSSIKSSLWITILSSLLQALVAIALVSVMLMAFKASMREVHAQAHIAIQVSYFCVLMLGVMVSYKALRAALGKHHHHAEQNQQNRIGLILAIGLRPCTGAIMVLLFANMVGLYWAGVLGSLMMAVGTCITTSTIALLVVSGKKLILKYLAYDDHKASSKSAIWLQLLGGLLVMCTGVLLLASATPAQVGLAF
ncbi:hypothetical protein [Vibrio sp. SCSIO 43136]|uniref:nickel/cobalt transporter n=1 Tax=Vibrio sp. SCSIO 43136 TaxID=2819101 RepID=UPI0020760C08|nr:hypothetical protein [Vibrio sp. SCSIO 43136]USD66936.1 hypothetical protein J4N39_20025 [Vibrio sp. SCSIO 43136]